MVGTGMYMRSIPYTSGLGQKQLAWMMHSAVIGAVIAPLMVLGGPLLMRAAAYTAGMVGGMCWRYWNLEVLVKMLCTLDSYQKVKL